MATIKCSLAVTRGRLNITGCTGREKVFVIEVTFPEVLAERGQTIQVETADDQHLTGRGITRRRLSARSPPASRASAR